MQSLVSAVRRRLAMPGLWLRARVISVRMRLLRLGALRLSRVAERLAKLSRSADRRAKTLMLATKPKRRGTGSPKTRHTERRRAAARDGSPAGAWHYVISGVGSREGLRYLLDANLFGRSFDHELLRVPPGDRILVLVPHQDDEGIGAAGTLIRSARAGKEIRLVYYTDGASGHGELHRDEVSRLRYGEARRAWRGLAQRLDFIGVPTGSPGVPARAVDRLVEIVEEFRPTTVFVPTFLEEPFEHRILNRWLLEAADRVPVDELDVWGYQITARAPGTAVVDITDVWRRKRRLNRAWSTSNTNFDYGHLAMGQDIANAMYLKGTKVVKSTAPHAEVFHRFSGREYLELCRRLFALEDSVEESLRNETPPPDFLVVGMQKSGTYWLTALLDAHPQIRCFPSRPGGGDGTGEAHLFDIMARLHGDPESFRRSMSRKLGGYFADLVEGPLPEGEAERAELRVAVSARFARYCDEQRRLHGKTFVGEKTTETVHHLDLVEELLPGVRKVAILRDPRDRVVSFHYHEARKGRRTDGPIRPEDVDAYVERVRIDYEGLLGVRDPYLVLTYEELSRSPVPTLVRLLRFLDAYASEDHARAMLAQASFERLAERDRGVEDAGSHYRKGVVGDWSAELDEASAERMVGALEPLTARIEERFGLDLSSYRASGASAPDRPRSASSA